MFEFERKRIVLISIYSKKYPSIGESHGLSCLASILKRDIKHLLEDISLIDTCASHQHINEKIQEKLKAKRPNVIAISANYGAYSELKSGFNLIRASLPKDCLIIIGGPLATYASKEVLQDICPTAILVVGEGEEVIADVVLAKGNRSKLKNIPNLAYVEDGIYRVTPRKLVKLENCPPPERSHVKSLYDMGAQIFTEASRGCSWAACSFCLRGLTDIKGSPKEYRRFPIVRLTSDISTLQKIGVKHVTFADEDFLGGKPEVVKEYTDKLKEFVEKSEININFHISATVHSLYSDKHSNQQMESVKSTLNNLRAIGVKKIFLGIESFSGSQLKRFLKGHSVEESIEAINLIKLHGFELEVGFIMFDPLCSSTEVLENIETITKHNLEQHISYLGNVLRLQVGSRYLKLIDKNGGVERLNINKSEPDLDTLSYRYSFKDDQINRLRVVLDEFDRQFKPLHYPLKSTLRFANGKFFGAFSNKANDLLIKIRRINASFIKQALVESTNNDDDLNKKIHEVANSVHSFYLLLSTDLKHNDIVSNWNRYAVNILKNSTVDSKSILAQMC